MASAIRSIEGTSFRLSARLRDKMRERSVRWKRPQWVGLLSALLAVHCGQAPAHITSPPPDAGGCGSDETLCAAAGFVCGAQRTTDFCGTVRPVECGACGANGSCDLSGRTCYCNQGYSGDGWTCTVAIGTSCPIGNGTRQNCPPGQVCISSQGVNVCDIVNCKTDLECGTNGIATNSCAITTGMSVCQENCFPNLPNACNNPDLVCLPASTSVASDASQCAISCHAEPAGWCARILFGGYCAAGGTCELMACKSNTDCPSGQICSPPTLGVANPFCAPDCRIAGNACPVSDSKCDPANGACDLPAGP